MSAIHTFENLCDRARALLRAPSFVLIALPVLLVWRLLATSPADPDLFARVAMGRLTLSLNGVPTKDPFAFTETLPTWIDHEWLSGVIFYLITTVAGDAGLILLKLLLSGSTAVCVLLASRRYLERFDGRFAWTTICVLHACSAWTSTIRCQAFTYLFIPLLLWAIIEYRNHRNGFFLWLSPLLAIVWVNMHGGYALGCVIIGILCISSLIERRCTKGLIAVAVAWALAPACTPYGLGTFFRYLFHALTMKRPTIDEWWPLLSDVPAFTITACLLALIAAGGFMQKTRHDSFGILLTIFSAYCAFKHQRFLPFLMITVAIFGAPAINVLIENACSRSPNRMTRLIRSFSCAIILLGGLLLLQLLSMTMRKESYKLTYDSYPLGALEWLRTKGITGRLLVDFNYGSIALWRLYPRFTVSVDGRYEETYPDQTLQDVTIAMTPSDPRSADIRQRLDPTHILLSKRYTNAKIASSFGEPWRVVYDDPDAILLSRNNDEGAFTSLEVARPPLDMWSPLF